MADKGIIFSAPMVRALLDGRKTQTRRLCAWANNPCSPALTYIVACDEPGWFGDEEGEVQFRVPYAPGDRLYVREAFSYADNRAETVWYWADGNIAAFDCGKPKPSIHMPRWASRLTLIVTDVRVQRVQEINEADAVREGVTLIEDSLGDPREAFTALWNKLHTKPGERWEDSPWVVAVSFTVHHGNIDQINHEGAGAGNRPGDIQR